MSCSISATLAYLTLFVYDSYPQSMRINCLKYMMSVMLPSSYTNLAQFQQDYRSVVVIHK